MLARCFNCLRRGHCKAVCREPTRCIRCGHPGNRSFECSRPRRAVGPPSHSRPEPTTRPHQSAAPPSQSCSEPTARVPAPPLEMPLGPSGWAKTASGDNHNNKLKRRRRKRRRGRRGAGQRRQEAVRRDGDRSHLPSHRGHHSRTPPPPSPRQECEARHDACFLDRTNDVEPCEAVLGYLLVFVQITGTKPPVEPEEARHAIATTFGLAEPSLEI